MAGNSGDRDNFSDDLVVPAPTGGVTKGLCYQLNSGLHVIARETAAQTVNANFAFRGAVWAEKDTAASSAIAPGGRVFRIAASGKVTGNGTGNTLIGAYCLESAADSATKVLIYLDGLSPTLT